MALWVVEEFIRGCIGGTFQRPAVWSTQEANHWARYRTPEIMTKLSSGAPGKPSNERQPTLGTLLWTSCGGSSRKSFTGRCPGKLPTGRPHCYRPAGRAERAVHATGACRRQPAGTRQRSPNLSQCPSTDRTAHHPSWQRRTANRVQVCHCRASNERWIGTWKATNWQLSQWVKLMALPIFIPDWKAWTFLSESQAHARLIRQLSELVLSLLV